MDEMRPGKKRSTILVVVSFLLAAVFLYFAMRQVDWAELFDTLRQANLRWLALGASLLSLSCLVRALRWRVLLSAEPGLPPGTQLSVSAVFWATMIGYLGNAYLPARAGEVFRSVAVGIKCGISKSFSLATALTERIADAVVLVAASGLALSTLPVLPPDLARAMRIMGIGGLIGASLVFIAPHIRGWVESMINRLPVLSPAMRETAIHLAGQFMLGAGALQNFRRLGQFLMYSVLIWTLDTLNGLCVAYAFGLNISMLQVFILLAALGLASALPSTPGAVGIYQWVAVNILVPFGLSQAQSLAYIFGFQGVQYFVITLWGVMGLWAMRGVLRLRQGGQPGSP